MDDQISEQALRVRKGFEKVLNQQGYGFQYSVLKAAKKMYDDGESECYFEASEFPVEVNGYGTRIDFILRRANRNYYVGPQPFYILAECKRANPSLSNWCFIRAPFVRRGGLHNCLIMDRIEFNEQDRFKSIGYIRPRPTNLFYQIAQVVKSDETGDVGGHGRDIIEDAATQVLRGVNGMINFFHGNSQILGDQKTAEFLPVIFTTAKIWVSEVDLSNADITKGEIDLSIAHFATQPWIFYQYQMSPGLKHGFSPNIKLTKLGDIMESEYSRTIAIVSSSGIENFLRMASALDLGY